MKLTKALMSGVALASLFMAGLPGPVLAQGPTLPVTHNNVKSQNGLVISLDDTKATALLGGETIVKGKVKNTGSDTLYNVGWTVALPDGVDYLGAKAGPAEYGSPKATILLWGQGREETVVHWANAADISPGEELWFEIRVKNRPPEGDQPQRGKRYKIEEEMELKAWAKGSSVASSVPVFQEYGYANYANDPSWTKDHQRVQIKGVESKLTIEEQHNGVTVRGNKADQRQKVTVRLDRTQYGQLDLTGPVTIDLDPVWEIMGTCVKPGGATCFTPTDADLRWDNGKWKLDIPAKHFVFTGEHVAEVAFEIAALDRDNEQPAPGQPKVNHAELGGDGRSGGAQNDVARLDPAYANNTGKHSQNVTVTIDGVGQARYQHPWHAADPQKYPNVDSVAIDLPQISTRVEDTSVALTTNMVEGGPYKNDKLAVKKLVVKNNEYALLPADRQITITLSEPECPVAKGTESCVTSGPIKLTRTYVNSDGHRETTEVDATVSKGAGNKYVVTIPADSLSPDTSTTQTFEFNTKVQRQANGKDVVNGKPLETKAQLSWTEPSGKIVVDAQASLPPALLEVLNTVAFPAANDGTCPAPMDAMPDAEGRKQLLEQEENKRLAGDVVGSDIWGKRRKVGSGKELCFHVLMKFPDGIVTKDPKLNLYLPPEAELVGDPSGIQVTRNFAGNQMLEPSSNIDTAKKPVDEPGKRTPLIFNLGDKAPGGAVLAMTYKAVIKNTSVADPDKPEVLYDNLAKLGYTDFEGGFSNARDLAGYEFINPVLMLAVDRPAIADVYRDASEKLTYTITNVGEAPVQPGTKVAIKLPEGLSCANVQIGAGVTKEDCVDQTKPGQDPALISGSFLLVSVNDAIGPKAASGTDNVKKFDITIKVPNSHAPKTTYELPAGIVGYKAQAGSNQTALYIPKANVYCKPQATGLDEQQAAALDKTCTEKIASGLFSIGNAANEIGKTVFVGANKATGGLTTEVNTTVTTALGSIRIDGTSQDTSNDTTSDKKIVVPGEKGNVNLVIEPNPTNDHGSAPEALDGAAFSAGDADIILVVRGVNKDNPAFLKNQDAIKDAFANKLGSDVVDRSAIRINPNGNDWLILVPIKKVPGKSKTIELPDLFSTSDKNVEIMASINHKPVTLVHRDNGPDRLAQPSLPGIKRLTAGALPQVFTRKVPTVVVDKQVANPVSNQVVGNSTVTYTVTVRNTSDVTAHELRVTDTLPDEFKHKAALTSVTVNGGADSALQAKNQWELSQGDRVGTWPSASEFFSLPGGASVTLTYVATAPALVTSAKAYTNKVQVPFASQPNNPLGVLKDEQVGQASVQGNKINSTTVVTNPHNRHQYGDQAIQHGDVVSTVTTIVVPGRVKVPNLSVLTDLSGATVDRTNATVTVECPVNPALSCADRVLLPGDPNKLGVNLKDGDFENTTDDPITIKVTVNNLLVTNGAGPIVAKGDAYIGDHAPAKLDDFASMSKSSDGSSGQVPIRVPALETSLQLLEGAGKNPVTNPIEPGTELTARITLTNTGEGSKLYNTAVTQLVDQLRAKGLTPTPSFQQTDLSNRVIEHGSPLVIDIPLDWSADKFTGDAKLNGVQQVTATGTGQTGPLHVISGAAAPETVGNTISASGHATFTPLYPQPQVTAAVTKIGGEPLSDTDPPQLPVGKEGIVTFTPTITEGQGFNPLLCVKVENMAPHAADPKGLTLGELHNPEQGVSIAKPNTACADGEVEVNLPTPKPGEALPTVSFKITNSGTPISDKLSTQITATLKVDSRIEKGDDTPGARSYTASTTRQVDVVPSVDIKVTSQWLKTDGTPFGDGEPAVYNDYDTETAPVKAKISIQNIGSDAATPQGSTVKVKIPTEFTIEGHPNKDGWECQVDTQTAETLLICSRVENLPGNQQDPFEVTIQSPFGPGVRLTTDPLVIRGGHNDNRGAVSPFDHNPSNDRVDTTAKVNIPKPDFAPVIEITDKLRRKSPDVKPFEVKVNHEGDPVRAHELKVRINGEGSHPTFTVTNPNGWQCTHPGILIECVWPKPVEAGQGKLPNISLTANMDGTSDVTELVATTEWHRSNAGSSPTIKVEDKLPANDINKISFTPFTGWVDAGVKVSFENPTPNPGDDPKPKVTISHVDGGKQIPAGTKVQVTVPPTAQVQDTAKVNSCTQKSADGNAVTYECQLVETIAPGVKVEGPNITGVAGPNQKIDAKIVLDEDPKQGNNEDSATTRTRPVPPPVAPVPSDVPSPKPEDRPTTIPPAPEPPAKPAPAKPGHTPAPKAPEERSNDWVEAVFPDNSKSRIVLIGRDNVFADSLSSGGLQGILDAPLLLNPVSHLSDKTKAALDRLQPEEVIILGGPVAQSPAVEEELIKLGWNVSRVAGPTRVETAIDAATVHAPTATHGILARAYSSDWGSGTQAFADALAGGALAARQQRPVFLTPTGELTDSLRAYLAKAKVKHLTVVGSTEAVSPAVEGELHKMGITTERIAGANRAETAVKVANSLGYWHAGEAEAALVVNGESEDAWTDAFPAALYAKRYELPVLLSGTDELLPETKQWIGPGIYRKPPTRVICGFSVGNVKECAFSPTKAPELQPDRPANN